MRKMQKLGWAGIRKGKVGKGQKRDITLTDVEETIIVTLFKVSQLPQPRSNPN